MSFLPAPFRHWPQSSRHLATLAISALATFGPASAVAQETPAVPPTTSAPAGKDDDAPKGSVKLRIQVTNPHGNPVANASVYIRFYKGAGVFHSDKLAELDLKTNHDGSVKVPPVPQGKIQIQVVAPGWHTFGQWYEITKDEQAVAIQLEEPAHWY